MKKITIVMLTLILVACGTKVQTVSEVKTVDWYLENRDVMQKVLAECSNNPGELAGDQNCINADAASTKAFFNQQGAGTVRPMRQSKY